jgi:enoyl-[acyl-carrier protein] reductase I
LLHYQQRNAPMRRSPTLDEVGGAGLYLLSDLSGAVTGEVHFVDCGYSTIAMPPLNVLKTIEHAEEAAPPVEKAPREAAQ